jgi:hypothetical protein
MSDFVKTWNESFINYAVEIAKIYKNNPDKILSCLGFDSVVGSLNETYQSLVKSKELQPIESLDLKTKNELWSKAKEYSDKKEKCVMICRVIYLLNQLT